MGRLPGCIVAIIFLAQVSCGQKVSEPYPALERGKGCEGLALFRQMGLTGDFVKRVFDCGHHERLTGLSQLVASLDRDGLDQIIAFLLTPKETEKGVTYPYIALLASLLDRGQEELLAFKYFADRESFDAALQDALLEWDPHFAARLFLEWSRLSPAGASHLAGVLDHLKRGIEPLAPDTISGLVASVLQDDGARDALVHLVAGVVDDPEDFAQAGGLFTPEALQMPLKQEIGPCLLDSLDPQIIKMEPHCQRSALGEGVSLLESYQALTNEVSPEALQGVFEVFLAAYEQTETKDQVRYGKLLVDFMSHWAGTSESPWRDGLSLIHLLRATKLEDLGVLIDEKGVLGDLLLRNLITLRALGLKIGALALVEKAQAFLLEGGVVPLCQNARWEGLDPEIFELGVGEFRGRLNQGLGPHDQCPGSLPLLVAYGINDCEPCQKELEARPLNPFPPLSTSSSSLPIEDLLSLLEEEFRLIAEELAEDPFFLKRKGIALQRIEAETFEKRGREFLADLAGQADVAGLVGAEERFQRETLKSLALVPDFLERVIDQLVKRLYSLSFHSNALFAREDSGEARLRAQKAMNLWLSGAYAYGPMETLFRKASDIDQWQGMEPHYLLSQSLSPLREAGQSFVSPLLSGEMSSFAYRAKGDSFDRLLALDQRQEIEGEVAEPARQNLSKFSPRFEIKDLLSLKDSPQSALGAEFEFGAPLPLTRVGPFALGEEGKMADLFIDDCDEGCPFHPKRHGELLEGVSFDVGKLAQRSLAFENKPLLSEHWRQVVWYITHRLAPPLMVLPEGTMVTGEMGSRFRLRDRFWNQPFSFDYLNSLPWSFISKTLPKSYVEGESFAEIFQADGGERWVFDFKNFHTPFEAARSEPSFFADLPESFKIFGSLGLFTLTGTKNPIRGVDDRRLQPLLSYSKAEPACLKGSGGVPSPCPLTLNDPAGLGPKMLFQHFNLMARAQVCQLFRGEWIQDETKEWLKKDLAFTDLDCQTSGIEHVLKRQNELLTRDLPVTPSLPKGFLSQILTDLRVMGVESRLKPWLSDLSENIRFERLKKKKDLLQLVAKGPLWQEKSAAWAQQYALDGKLGPYEPSLVESYFSTYAFVDDEVGIRKSLHSALAMAEIDVSEEGFGHTALVQYLKTRVLQKNQSEQAEHSVLRFLIEEIHYLASKESPQVAKIRRQLSLLLAKPLHAQGMNILSLLDPAMAGGYQAFYGDSLLLDWRLDHGLRLYKTFLNPIYFSRFTRLFQELSSKDVEALIITLSKALKALGPTPELQEERLQSLMDWLAGRHLGLKEGRNQSVSFEQGVKSLLRGIGRDWGGDRLEAFSKLLLAPSGTFTSYASKGILDRESGNRDHLLGFVFEPKAGGLAMWQDLFLNHSLSSAEVRSLLIGMLRPLKSQTSSRGIYEFLQLERMGLVNSEFILERSLFEASNRSQLIGLLKALQRADLRVWRDSNQEFLDVAPEFYGFVSLFEKNLTFPSPSEGEAYMRFVQALGNVMSPSGMTLRNQTQVVEQWLTPRNLDAPSGG